MPLILLVLFVWIPANAQNITASFNSSAIGENPAAAATREFGIVTPSASMTEITQDITPVTTQNGDINWDRHINLTKFELVIGGKGKKVVPEIYAAQSNAKIDVETSGGGNKYKNDVSLFTGILNMAFHVNSSIKMGITVFNPQMTYKTESAYSANDGKLYQYLGQNDLNVLGGGFGLTAYPFKSIAVGIFTHKIQESNKNTQRQTTDGTQTSQTTTSESYENEKTGLGFAVQKG